MIHFYVTERVRLKYNPRWKQVDRIKVLEWLVLHPDSNVFDRITSESATMGYAVSPSNRLEFEEVGVPVWGY